MTHRGNDAPGLVIQVGIDDTDLIDTPGTNQLARALVQTVADEYRCLRITRHQLLDDPRVPYTSHNGSASILLAPVGEPDRERLIGRLRERMQQWFVDGSDPGLCVAEEVSEEVVAFGRRCKREVVDQATARSLAQAAGIHLEGLGGTEGGVIGALAAVGLSHTGDDGRLVQLGAWPDDLSGIQPLGVLEERGVEVRRLDTEATVRSGSVDVGKHLRPNLRGDKAVLFVQSASEARRLAVDTRRHAVDARRHAVDAHGHAVDAHGHAVVGGGHAVDGGGAATRHPSTAHGEGRPAGDAQQPAADWVAVRLK